MDLGMGNDKDEFFLGVGRFSFEKYDKEDEFVHPFCLGQVICLGQAQIIKKKGIYSSQQNN